MLVIDSVVNVFGDILRKQENKFALVTFFWSILVVGKKKRDGTWEDGEWECRSLFSIVGSNRHTCKEAVRNVNRL